MKICIDAGHSGLKYNKGVSAGYYESAVMWDYHKLLKAELEKYGVEVVTTRIAPNVSGSTRSVPKQDLCTKQIEGSSKALSRRFH